MNIKRVFSKELNLLEKSKVQYIYIYTLYTYTHTHTHTLSVFLFPWTTTGLTKQLLENKFPYTQEPNAVI